MRPIIAIIKPGDHGARVANLQDALVALYEHKIIRQRITQGLKDERAKSLFGPSTGQLVMYFQVQQGLGDKLRDVGVEEKTAAKLNEWLKKLRLLDIPESGASGYRIMQSVVLCVGALMCLLGATWLDILAQHEGARSAWELVSPKREHAKIFEADQIRCITYPGTGLDVTSIQTNLCVGLNNGLPVSLYGIKPLYPPKVLENSSVDFRPATSTKVTIVIWWACTFAIVGAPMLLRGLMSRRSTRNLQKLLAGTAIGLLVTYLTMLFLPSWAKPLSMLIIALHLLAVAVFLGAPLLSSQETGKLEGAARTINRGAIASVYAMTSGSLGFVSFAVFSWAAIWLGWYTYDMRVNLLEPAPSMLGILGVALSALAFLVTLAIPKEGRPSWVGISVVALIALVMTQAPVPSRQSIGEDYILLNSNEVVRYENSLGARATIPEQALALRGEISSQEADAFLAFQEERAKNFNSANLFSHVPVSLSWLRPFVMLAALTALCAGLVFAVRGSVQALVSARCVLSAPRPMGVVLLVLTCGSVMYSFYYAAKQVRTSFASHGIARMLVLSPARIVEPAFCSYAAYFSNPEDIPQFARSYFNLVRELDKYSVTTLDNLNQSRMSYFIYGAGDWMVGGSRKELEDKAKQLELANYHSSALTDRLRDFPAAVERALINDGVESALASASRQNWERWTRGGLAFMNVQNEELALHRKYISALLDAPSEALTRLLYGAVVIRPEASDKSELPRLKLEGIRATLALELARKQSSFAFLSETDAGNYEPFIRIMKAYERLLRCFEDPLSFTVSGSEGETRWRDDSINGICSEAALDVGKVQRGEF